MASNDSIMIQKYYEGTSLIINLSTEIGKLLGIVDATYLRKPETRLRRENKLRTIQSSLEIEGNTLSLDQVTAIFENKRVIGPSKDIIEVQNAIKIYNGLSTFRPFEEESYLLAHKTLMKGLVDSPGQYRTKGVGVFKGQEVAHMAPPAWNVHNLMQNLFEYLNKGEDNPLIKSCVFHYEMEFIHPFMDGNGRMGRLWQTLILMKENPIFEFLPIEQEIKSRQEDYYKALSLSDKSGISTAFVEYMLGVVRTSLKRLVDDQRKILNDEERIQYFFEHSDLKEFTRKDYMTIFKTISGATATRDLKKAVNNHILSKIGDNRNTKYKFKKRI
jgi:Fic family protein